MCRMGKYACFSSVVRCCVLERASRVRRPRRERWSVSGFVVHVDIMFRILR